MELSTKKRKADIRSVARTHALAHIKYHLRNVKNVVLFSFLQCSLKRSPLKSQVFAFDKVGIIDHCYLLCHCEKSSRNNDR